MKPSELYAREPEELTLNIMFRNYNVEQIPEIPVTCSSEIDWSENKKILQKVYKEFDFDGRRLWRLSSLWWMRAEHNEQPFMILRNAGREGDDWCDGIITNKELYYKAISYIRSLMPIELEDIVITDTEEDIIDLDNFYGNSLEGYFKRYG